MIYPEYILKECQNPKCKRYEFHYITRKVFNSLVQLELECFNCKHKTYVSQESLNVK